jgi:TonB family protein
MKRAWVSILLSFALAPALVCGQQPGNNSAVTLAYENGRIENNTYTNECLGFSLAIPDGWQVNSQLLGADGKASHVAKGVLFLLVIDQQKPGSALKRVGLYARDASASAASAQEFVSAAIHGQVTLDPEHRQLVRDTFSVDYGGKHFSRADYKQTLANGTTFYLAFIYTKFRGYYIGGNLAAGSPDELDQSANSLQHISFLEDVPNPKCVMSAAPDNATLGGVPGGVISSKPSPSPSDPATAQRVRISSGVSSGLLIKKVSPQYPDDAKQARIQGQVVLQAEIDKDGNIENLSLISGHPMLAPAAIEAVKQWQYKPYLLNGQPVKVETQVIVNFTLLEH